METGLMRIGVSLPDALLEKFDGIIKEKGYPSRSEAIRDAITSYITYYRWMGDIKGHRVGTIAVIYDLTKHGLSNALIEVQHRYSHLIKYSVHLYLGHEEGFELIVLDGSGQEITELAGAIIAIKGVKFSKLTTIAPDVK
ncbi:nickel-responsive transcriptional regulator NikR [Methanosarcina sp.]|jgi:CopG family nickel-responsive transcriptional regulator|uniref:nickel-responsive transcriptional regulator NikR n=1 Tax=Methanosarcina sp. TaxID=2213 RepID=UPI002C3A8C30|nr:nickel-responsive transcriptional regulator NikR [Methanosarcina sp.]HOW13548.1 nickel-responsive transcriptional regulator NikR [Methanosarcina sp.]